MASRNSMADECDGEKKKMLLGSLGAEHRNKSRKERGPGTISSTKGHNFITHSDMTKSVVYKT